MPIPKANPAEAAQQALATVEAKPTQAVTKGSEFKNFIEQMKPQFAQALSRINTDRYTSSIFTAFRKSEKLQQCTKISIANALLQSAQLDLLPNTALGHAYLVPRKNECTLQIGYRGLIELARRSGEIASIKANVVYEKDEFVYEFGMEERFRHVPNEDADRGRPRYAYAYARLKDGAFQFEVMSFNEIEKIRKGSDYGTSGPWVNHWDEMAKKTVLKRLCKLLPSSLEVMQAIEADESPGYTSITGTGHLEEYRAGIAETVNTDTGEIHEIVEEETTA